MSKSTHGIEKLSKLLVYVLGRRPDEFGLVLDSDGFVNIKSLLQALHEESGWRHIRNVHLNEVIQTLSMPSIQIEGNRICALDRSLLPQPIPLDLPPKLLYFAVRKRAYPIVMEKGLNAISPSYLILSSAKTMAMRIGRRLDRDPILLTVHVGDSIKQGALYQQYGQQLFLTERLYLGTFNGPPLSKDKKENKEGIVPQKAAQVKTPGSYFPDLELSKQSDSDRLKKNRRKEPEWKKERRQARKEKSFRNQ